jgi:hypothetical protein
LPHLLSHSLKNGVIAPALERPLLSGRAPAPSASLFPDSLFPNPFFPPNQALAGAAALAARLQLKSPLFPLDSLPQIGYNLIVMVKSLAILHNSICKRNVRVRQPLSLSLSLSLNIEETFQFSPLHSLYEYFYSLGKMPGLPVGTNTGFLILPLRAV